MPLFRPSPNRGHTLVCNAPQRSEDPWLIAILPYMKNFLKA